MMQKAREKGIFSRISLKKFGEIKNLIITLRRKKLKTEY